MKLRMVATLALVALAPMTFSACQTAGQGTATGALTGGALAAGAGALLDSRHPGTGAIVGGVAGAVAGGVVGNQLGANNERNDRQDQAIGQAQQDANTVIVNVPTSTGGTVPVKLVRQGAVWIGPHNEQYTSIPTPDALRSAYGF